MFRMKPWVIVTLLAPMGALAQDTLALRPIATLPGSEILFLENHQAAVRASERGHGSFTRYLDVYDLSDSTAPRRIDHCLEMWAGWDDFHETVYYQVQGDAVLEDSILYVTLNNEVNHGSIDPFTFIGPLTVKAHVIGTDRDLWDIAILDSLYDAEEDSASGEYRPANYLLPRSLIRYGDYLIVAAGSWGVRIYDISDRMSPTQVAQIDTVAKIASLWLDVLVLVRNEFCFDVFDISDPTNPEAVGSIDVSEERLREVNLMQTSLYGFMSPACYSFYGDFMYVPTCTRTGQADPQIVVFDIKDDEPTEVARFAVPFWNSGSYKYIRFTIGNGRLYTIHQNLLDIYELEDPLSPRLLTTMTFDAHDSDQMIAQDNQLYLSYGGDNWGSDSGLVTIYNVGPNSVRPFPLTPYTLSLSPFPNPFNSSATISYTLPRPGRYALDVVDISGRLVTRLSDGWKEAGSYRSVFQGDELPSGTFMIRLEGGSASAAQRIELVK